MLKQMKAVAMFAALTLAAWHMAMGQSAVDTEALLVAQRHAMESLSYMDGEWRGTAWMLLPTGERHTVTQTERIGPFLEGSVKVIEGRGYEGDGSVSFNALGVISFDPLGETYSLRSYAQGLVGDFPLTLSVGGYSWEIPAGPVTIKYTATVTDSTWLEVGDRIMPDQDPIRFFEMNLIRVGDTDWPAADPMGPN